MNKFLQIGATSFVKFDEIIGLAIFLDGYPTVWEALLEKKAKNNVSILQVQTRTDAFDVEEDFEDAVILWFDRQKLETKDINNDLERN